KKGILVKGSNYLEALNNSEIFVFDKTGTLTEGVFGVTEVKSFANISEGGILKYAAYAEYFSSHPMAVSIKNYYSGEIDPSKIENYQDIAGKGISANVFGEHVLAGNSKLLKDYGIGTVPDMGLYHDGSIMHIAVSGLYAGYIVVSDKVKATSKDAIERLHKAGAKEIIMLTGDNKINAEKVGQSLGVDRIYSELLPQGKVEALEAIMDGHAGKVAFIGDGINDAPVLRRADVGIAMGGLGSDAAIEASDVVIMNDDVLKIVTAKEITKYTHKIVYQNIIFSLGVKVLFLILGVFSIIGMEGAIFADVGVSLIAILNSLRILNRR
ncbi:MAG: HAD-IC family P-type ATPase, partial [Clostridiales bacterium]|nr:HAD-IC family P-type ATPase [Clostridiales bacterium]